jgi:hypothetical protein
MASTKDAAIAFAREKAADKLLTKIVTGGLFKSGVNQAAAR